MRDDEQTNRRTDEDEWMDGWIACVMMNERGHGSMRDETTDKLLTLETLERRGQDGRGANETLRTIR